MKFRIPLELRWFVRLTGFPSNSYNYILCSGSLEMKITIAEIPKEGLDIEIQEAIDAGIVSSPVTARLRIEKLGEEIMVKGDMRAEVRLQCSRCLKEFSRDMSLPVDVVYHPVEELKGEEHHKVASDELDMDFYSGEEVDLLDLLQEQVSLNMTMKPLCSDFCKGICPGCGADLNVDICKCGEKNIGGLVN
jgi:uncharacterized protein